MRAKDYIFRTAAVAAVWIALAGMVIESALFVPVDLWETLVAHAVLATGCLCTLIIWCGPELIGRFRQRQDTRYEDHNRLQSRD